MMDGCSTKYQVNQLNSNENNEDNNNQALSMIDWINKTTATFKHYLTKWESLQKSMKTIQLYQNHS